MDADKLIEILKSAGIPETDVSTDHTDAYSYGQKSLAVKLASQKDLARFFKAAENHLTRDEFNRRLGRMRDDGAPNKIGNHKGGKVVFPDFLT